MTDPLLFPDDRQFWYETLRALGQTAFGGADTGEVLATAAQIKPGDYDSWHDAWYATAERLRAEADAAAAAGHQVSAGDSYLRASTYYRSAEFFLHGNPDDPRIDRSYFASVDCFRAYAARSGLSRPALSIEPVQIPYEHTVLHGYLYRSPEAGPRPAMVLHSGYDGAAEEMHFNGALSGVERGYTVLTFDGPGQPAARHRDGLLFRPDWEHVVGPVLDWFLDRPEVDASRTGLLGLSLGGLLAPRAAAFEPRLAACVAVDGVYRFGAAAEQAGPTAQDGTAPTGRGAPPNPTVRWAIDQARYVMGVRSADDFVALSRDYSLAGGIAEQIQCPTLVCEAEDDMFFAGQPQELYDHLTCPKTLMRFTAAEGAGAHCHTGAQRLAFGRIYDWLDETLAGR